MAGLDAQTPAILRAARDGDRDAPLLRSENLGRVVATAIDTRQFEVAKAVADFGPTIHPAAVVFLGYVRAVVFFTLRDTGVGGLCLSSSPSAGGTSWRMDRAGRHASW